MAPLARWTERSRIIGKVSAENVRVVEEIQMALTAGDVVAALNDPETDSRVRQTFAELAENDFETVMVGPDYVAARLESTGFDGFRDSWLDWTSPFASYTVELERMIDGGDQVVSFVAMTGKTRTGGVEINAPGAAVWTIVDGRVRRVEFHIDRDAALRAAGLEPGA
jgi:ketosteroid isomerase-like protein